MINPKDVLYVVDDVSFGHHRTYRSGAARPKIIVKLLFFTLFHYNFPKKSLLDVLKCIIGTSVKFYVGIAFQNIEIALSKHH